MNISNCTSLITDILAADNCFRDQWRPLYKLELTRSSATFLYEVFNLKRFRIINHMYGIDNNGKLMSDEYAAYSLGMDDEEYIKQRNDEIQEIGSIIRSIDLQCLNIFISESPSMIHESQEDIYKRPIEDLSQIATKIYNCLKKNDICSIGETAEVVLHDKEIDGLTENDKDKIKIELKRLGVSDI